MAKYQAKKVVWRRLDGGVDEFGACTVVIEGNIAIVNILGNPKPGNTVPTNASTPSPIDMIDFITTMDRLDLFDVKQ